MRNHVTALALSLVIGMTGHAAAQDQPKAVPQNPKIASTEEPNSSSAPAPVTAGWQITENTSALTGAASYAAVLQSSNAVTNSIGIADRAALVIRCTGRDIAVYVDWPFYLGNRDVLTGYRFDQGRIIFNWLNVSEDGTASGFFRGRGSERLLQSIAESRSFVIQGAPYSGSTREAVFDLSEAAAVTAEVRNRCTR